MNDIRSLLACSMHITVIGALLTPLTIRITISIVHMSVIIEYMFDFIISKSIFIIPKLNTDGYSQKQRLGKFSIIQDK